jgi:glucose/arabinose dehydrogenase
MVLALPGCGNGGGGGLDGPGNAGGTAGAPVITSFTAAPAIVTAGSPSTLTGVFSGGTGTVDQGVGNVASGTGVPVSPPATTTYTLTVTGPTGSEATAAATVTVVAAPATPVITVPAVVAAGATGINASVPPQPGSTYAWTLTDATVSSGAATPQITFTVTGAVGGTVQLQCVVTNAAGTASSPGTTVCAIEAAPGTPMITAPANLSRGLSDAVPVTAALADSTGIAAVEFQLDGAALGSATAPPYTVTLPATSAYADGQHVFQARSRDGAGATSPWAASVVQFASGATLPAGFAATTLAGTLTAATALDMAPDGRIFVCEQGGTVRIFENGALLAAPFATLPTLANGERGLLGIAFDPAFAANGHLYVYYTASTPAFHNRISRLTADPDAPDQMLAGSEAALVDLPDLNSTDHNGGAVHFGPDGKLYVAVGNNVVNSNSQSLATTLGKVLRYNPDGSIPADNPFVPVTTGPDQAIWAIGVRNIFNFAFQPGTGLMYLDHVGENTWECVIPGLAGANYGWPATEGPTSAPGVTPPIFAYGHSDGLPPGQPASTGTFLQGTAILGAAFDPPGSPWPAAYQGSYYFSDLSGGWIARMHLASGTVSTFMNGLGSMRGLAFGTDGALYVLTDVALQKVSPP